MTALVAAQADCWYMRGTRLAKRSTRMGSSPLPTRSSVTWTDFFFWMRPPSVRGAASTLVTTGTRGSEKLTRESSAASLSAAGGIRLQ